MKQKNDLIPRPVKIIDVYQESHDTYTLTLDEKSNHRPGQFIQVSIIGVGEAPISISSYSPKYIKISVRVVGNVTRAISKLKKGDKLHIRGPFGNGYNLTEHQGKNLILIGGGCGVAPLKGAIEYVEANRDMFAEVHLYLGFYDPENILFQRELKQWAKKYKLTVMVSQSSSKSCYTGPVGHITEGLKGLELKNPQDYIVLLCGPPIMIKSAIEILNKNKIKNSQIYISAERLMQCAVGQCCHCMIHGKFVCTDGPVFCYEDIHNFKND